MSLQHFQSTFAGALLSGDTTGLAAQPAFAVYRNTVMKGCIDALEANYPSVARLVGSDWFRAAAALHVAADPPTDGRLRRYGAGFADFLAGFEPARALDYLPDVARLDRSWTEAHAAADVEAVDCAWLAALAPEAIGEARLRPHPAARWHWFAEAPITTLWQRNRHDIDMDMDSDTAAPLDWRGEGALLTRPGDAVRWCHASQADGVFLDACANGLSLGEAAATTLAAHPDTDLAARLAHLLGAGALVLDTTTKGHP